MSSQRSNRLAISDMYSSFIAIFLSFWFDNRRCLWYYIFGNSGCYVFGSCGHSFGGSARVFSFLMPR